MKETQRKLAVSPEQAVTTSWRVPGDYDGGTAVILAHGAGNDMHSEFLVALCERWSSAGMMTVRFNFPYKEKGGRLPDRAPVLIDTWRAVAESVMKDPALAPRRLFFAGKSLGGRIASMLAAGEADPAGLVFLGYPLHPAGKPDQLRINHLGDVRCPMLFIQGTRDALCDLTILARVLEDLDDPKNELHRVEGGDHSFKLPKKLGRSAADVYDEIADRARVFMTG